MVFPSGRHAAVAVDRRRVVQNAGRQIQENVRRAWCQVLQGVQHGAPSMKCFEVRHKDALNS